MTLVALFVYPCFPQVGEIMWYLSSWDWLISHNMRIKKYHPFVRNLYQLLTYGILCWQPKLNKTARLVQHSKINYFNPLQQTRNRGENFKCFEEHPQNIFRKKK
jgi:hypothetical protein